MLNWNALASWVPNIVAELANGKSQPFGLDLSIEGMNSQEFSRGIFYFLIVAIIIFVGIVFLFMRKDKVNTLKKGEKWLFAWIFLGVVVAVAIGAAQMINGYLF